MENTDVFNVRDMYLKMSVYDVICKYFNFFVELLKDFDSKILSEYLEFFDKLSKNNKHYDRILSEHLEIFNIFKVVFTSKILYKYLIETCIDIEAKKEIILNTPTSDIVRDCIFESLDKYKKSDIEQYITLQYNSTKTKLIGFYDNNVNFRELPLHYIKYFEEDKRGFYFRLKKQEKTKVDDFFIDILNEPELLTVDNLKKEVEKREIVEDFLNGYYNDMLNEQKITTVNNFFNDILSELDAGYNEIMKVFVDNTEKDDIRRIIIPANIFNWLQETKCNNGKGFIENSTVRPMKWLQNKQLARELLTHNKIKGTLTDADVERQTPSLFTYKDGNPLILAKNKVVLNSDSDRLAKILATL